MKQDSEETFEALLKRQLRDNRGAAHVSTDCPDENIVSAYLEGSLVENLRTDFETHASLCARCQDELGLLVKSQEVALASSAAAPPVSAAQSGWVATLQAGWTWLLSLGPKPALAVLTVMLISGYIGVELFQREWQGRKSATDVAYTVPQDPGDTKEDKQDVSAPDAEDGTTESVHLSAAKENLKTKQEGHLTSAKNVVGADAKATFSYDRFPKDAGQGRLLRDTYSPVFPES